MKISRKDFLKKIEAMVATSEIDCFGKRFSPEALEDMVQQLPGNPIKIEFEHQIGLVESAEIVDGSIEVSGVIDVDLEGVENQDIYLVPGFKMAIGDFRVEGGIRTIRHLELSCLGLTDSPADKNLTPIRWLDED